MVGLMTIGILFKETMKGPFAFGSTEEADGARKGDTDRATLAMHATVSIDDLDRFIADPDHFGILTGTIDYTTWDTGIPSTKGVFNLFLPIDRTDTKHMVYELGFTLDGAEVYLAGHKVVRDDPGFDSWSDTTTLYTKLYKGSDKNGAIMGAGILSLSVTGFAALVSTLRATGTVSTALKSKAIAKFGAYFAGELWNSYGP